MKFILIIPRNHRKKTEFIDRSIFDIFILKHWLNLFEHKLTRVNIVCCFYRIQVSVFDETVFFQMVRRARNTKRNTDRSSERRSELQQPDDVAMPIDRTVHAVAVARVRAHGQLHSASGGVEHRSGDHRR